VRDAESSRIAWWDAADWERVDDRLPGFFERLEEGFFLLALAEAPAD